jgi:DNA-binding NarL/FixJ family response regulator
MNPQDLSALTVYQDLMTVLQERGYSDAEAAEILLKLTAQAEMEVVEEIIGKLSEEQMALLDSLPANAAASEIAEKLGLDGEEIDAIRAQKVALLLEELAPAIDKGDEEVESSPKTSA